MPLPIFHLGLFGGCKMTEKISLLINGQPHTLAADPDTPLLYILRNDLGQVGAKFACGLEQCGACVVWMDGKPRPSCKIPLREVVGKSITTIENLPRAGMPHRVQQAFIEEQAIQCGFCTAGFVVAAVNLLDHNPNPTDEEIHIALGRHLCRCGVYPRILRAVKRAAGQTLEPAITVLDRPLVEIVGGGTLPGSFERSPELDEWVRIDSDETVTIFVGKVEYGQGILTPFVQLAAEELDVSLARMRVVTAETGQTPNEGMTTGSMSLETTGNAIRWAAAAARQFLLALALEELEAAPENLVVEDGRVMDRVSGRSTTYWELFGGKKFECKVAGNAPLKSPLDYQVVGQPEKRLDLQAKVTGAPAFLHDLTLPGMVYARVVRPPEQFPQIQPNYLVFVPEEVEEFPGVLKVVRDGNFLGVIAEREEEAVRAWEYLMGNTIWATIPKISIQQLDHTKLQGHLQSQPAQSFLIVDGTAVTDPIPEKFTPPNAAQTLRATYFRPFHMHASLGPSSGVALMEGGKLTVWTHAQGVYPVRAVIAHALEMAEADVHVIHREGPGCYGQNGADDAAFDAALLARAFPGRPVSLKWMRADEHRWEPYGPAMAMEMEASLDADGEIVAWSHEVWSYPHLGRPRAGGRRVSGLLAAWSLAEPFERPISQPSMWNHVGAHRNADPLYVFPNKRVVKHSVADSPFRTSSMRGLGAYGNVFAIESFMDELAHAAGVDPVAFRLRYLKDSRAREVLEALPSPPAPLPQKGEGGRRGRGVAFARYKNRASYCAVVVEVSVNEETGDIRLEQAVIAADAGQIVNPDGLSNQLEGGLIQSASWTLKEQVQFDRAGVTSVDWETYPLLKFAEAPVVKTILLNRPGAPFLGGGEASQGPTGAAIANAVFDAMGVRVRELPLTPEKVREALEQRI